MNKCVSVLTMAVAFAATAAPAQTAPQSSGPFFARTFVDGDDLLQYCDSMAPEPMRSKHRYYCSGFITGVVDMDATSHAVIDVGLICIPEGVPVSALTNIVVAYLKRDSKRRSENGASAVLGALGDVFPCPKK